MSLNSPIYPYPTSPHFHSNNTSNTSNSSNSNVLNTPSTINNTSIDNANGKKLSIQSLLLSSIQPICDVSLQVTSVKILTKSLIITEKEPGVLMAGKYILNLIWYYSETAYICQNEERHKNDKIEERPISVIQCLCCKRSFCCNDCFLHSWHHERHRNEEYHLNNDKEDKSETYHLIDIDSRSTRIYTPKKEDIGRVLRVKAQLFDINKSQPVSNEIYLDTKPVLHFPNFYPNRYILPITPNQPNPRTRNISFTIMSYNVLAEMYATKTMVPHCPSHFLDFNFRKLNLIREINKAHPDIVCLQEVQAEHFDTFWLPELAKSGYHGLFKKKTKDVFTGAGKYSMDGCATFYRQDLFDLIRSEEIEFRDLAMQRLQVNKNQNLTRMIKDNVALVLFLRPKYFGPNMNDNVFCVGNTHIMANPQYTDVKIWQVYAFLQELYHLTNQGTIPLVLAGDFNSTPDSGAYHLIVNNQVPLNHPDLQTAHSIHDVHWKHDLELRSAYGGHKNEPNCTTKTPTFKGSLDYIFYTPRSIGLMGLLNIPELEPDEYMPNEKYSSDHFSLMAKLEILSAYR